ncbi:TetR family transcriptional regulator [Blastococcus sp. TF02A_35]|uniref:TetR/AcrR family transcriptional regulator n=1 Tax=Blastococcus sp. TF02A-35 TaxID=2559612 RepID=UPI0010749BDC|nr:TetR family transcriptional regulator [Blastococcus sp. TF02A_35]TFV47199.1 TetR/AcrR family transcriptional regulator [Blastococcus sp. TF02A_35]
MTSPAPRRSDTTRAAILEAARDRFAADGYERATIRAIAADADIDPAMVMRYYGSKERLFAAAAEFDLRLPDLVGVAAAQAARILVGHFLQRWEEDETLTALLRAASTNESAAERMRAVFAQQVAPVIAPFAPVSAQAPARAGLVAATILGAAFTRFVLRLGPVTAIGQDELIAWLAPTVQHYMTAKRP